MKLDWLKKFIGKKYKVEASQWVYESKNVRSVIIPMNSLDDYKYSPGDYIYARHKNDSWLKFNITSSPLQNYISISSKEVGKYQKFFAMLGQNSSIQLTKAFQANYRLSRKKEIVFIAKGMGIFPILGTLRDIKMRDDKQKSTLIYQNLSDIYESFKSELRLMNRSKWFQLIEVYSHIYPPRKGQKLVQIKGKITKTLLKRNLKKHQVENAQFFISMQDQNKKIHQSLTELGIRKRNIVIVNA